MSSKKTHDLVATVGSYTDRKTGQEKRNYQNCGFACTNEKGQITSVKILSLPQAFKDMEWEGWLNLYPLKNDPADFEQTPQRQPQQQPQRQQPQQQPQQQQQASAFDADDIPF